MLDRAKEAIASRAALAVITAFASVAGTWLLATYPTVHNALCRGSF